MRDARELRDLCYAIREKRRPADDKLIDDIEAEVRAYRDVWSAHRGAPPEKLVELLPLMGWLIYEASLDALFRIPPAFSGPTEAGPDVASASYRRVGRLAEAARSMPWPEHAPRALGAFRAHALAESKRDTDDGYDAAYILHTEARERWSSLHEAVAEDPDSPQATAFDEVLLQLALAEIGTACRIAERMICRWAEGLDDGRWTAGDEAFRVQRIFRELSAGRSVGEFALGVVDRLERRDALGTKVDENRLALVTARRNPAIMTARASLMLLVLSFEMEIYGRSPSSADTWPDYRQGLLNSFTNAYALIERPVHQPDGSLWPLSRDHLRSLVQLRLTAAIAVPGLSIKPAIESPPCLAVDPLTEQAVQQMSAWLAAGVEGRRQGDANVIGSATMPAFIRSVDACRASRGSFGGYREWRKEWAYLDRYAGEPDRSAVVWRAL